MIYYEHTQSDHSGKIPFWCLRGHVCHVATRRVTARHATPRHIKSYRNKPRYGTKWHATSRHTHARARTHTHHTHTHTHHKHTHTHTHERHVASRQGMPLHATHLRLAPVGGHVGRVCDLSVCLAEVLFRVERVETHAVARAIGDENGAVLGTL
jgi:hypothetical protein